MLNPKDFEDLRKEVQHYDADREELIKQSRVVLKLSKQVIYALHRDELKEVEKLVAEIQQEKKKMDGIAKRHAALQFEGSFFVSRQEYVEALLYYHYLKDKKIVSSRELGVSAVEYVLGLCDLTGELLRKGVFLAGKGRFEEVVQIAAVVDEIYGALLKCDFRDHEVRKKMDAIKYSLLKLEDLVLDLRLKEKI